MGEVLKNHLEITDPESVIFISQVVKGFEGEGKLVLVEEGRAKLQT